MVALRFEDVHQDPVLRIVERENVVDLKSFGLPENFNMDKYNEFLTQMMRMSGKQLEVLKSNPDPHIQQCLMVILTGKNNVEEYRDALEDLQRDFSLNRFDNEGYDQDTDTAVQMVDKYEL